jgi:hypothetical protein
MTRGPLVDSPELAGVIKNGVFHQTASTTNNKPKAPGNKPVSQSSSPKKN